ncbi:MAG: hypothetical protein WCQ95_05795 [Bacteroidota bacterium]
MELLLTLLYTLLFLFLIYKLPFFTLAGFSKRSLLLVYLLKVAAGLFMYALYTYYYTDRNTADIFKYFDDSKIMYDALWHHPVDYLKMMTGLGNDTPHFDVYYKQMNNWYRVFESNLYNDSHTIIRFNALLRLFSFGYFNVHTVVMCFLSLTGLVALYKFFAAYLANKKYELFFAVFLIPSVVFWGSGVLKESILLFGMGTILYNLGAMLQGKMRVRNLLWFLLALLLLVYTKYYIFIIWLPLLLSFVWCHFTGNRRCGLKYLVVVAGCVLVALNLHYVLPNYNVMQLLAMKQHDFIGLAQQMNSGSLLTNIPLQPTLADMLKHAPLAFYNTLFRPYPFEAHSAIILFAAIENLLLLAIILFCLVFACKKPPHQNILYFALLFFVATFVLTGLTTPVVGAMVRYKVPALPFMLLFFLMLADKEKMLRKLPFLRRFLP